jgi:hypothetical protein
MKSRQQGVTMVGMMFIAGLIVFFSITGLKLIPAYIEFATIQNHLRELARSPDTRGASPRDIQSAFNRRKHIDNITSVDGRDIEIEKDGGEIVLVLAYENRIHMMGNITACIDFEATSE